MKVQIYMQPQFWLEISQKEVDPLCILGDHHYDSVCRAATKQGGFIYGWRNQVAFNIESNQEEAPFCSATRRELDTLLKLCEPLRMLHMAKLVTDDQRTAIDQLCATVLTAIEQATHAVSAMRPITIDQPTARGRLLWSTAEGRF